MSRQSTVINSILFRRVVTKKKHLKRFSLFSCEATVDHENILLLFTEFWPFAVRTSFAQTQSRSESPRYPCPVELETNTWALGTKLRMKQRARYNLGQNKKEQLTPSPRPPRKAMMKAGRSKNAPFWHH